MNKRRSTPAPGARRKARSPALCAEGSVIGSDDPLVGPRPTQRDSIALAEPQGPAMSRDSAARNLDHILDEGAEEQLLPDHAAEVEIGGAFLDAQQHAFRSNSDRDGAVGAGGGEATAAELDLTVFAAAGNEIRLAHEGRNE